MTKPPLPEFSPEYVSKLKGLDLTKKIQLDCIKIVDYFISFD